ncbi:MAG: VCBS repeat-containing protein [Halobacteriales archaeon]|nr:VCBS repeat-containing protein [Halobacteriales archaeon]
MYAVAGVEMHRYVMHDTWVRELAGTTTNVALADVTFQDVDGDGNQEAYVIAWANGHLYRMRFDGSWHLDDLGGAGTYGLAVAAGDADLDGHREVYTLSVGVPGSYNAAYRWKP